MILSTTHPHDVFGICPVCDYQLHVHRLHCEQCNTTIENTFLLNRFTFLTREQIELLDTFLACRGNMKDIERKLKISYPTIRTRLDDLFNTLGYEN